MVWTVLTGIREIATLENICPPTWKTPIGNVLSKIARVGLRTREKRTTGLIKSKQYPATKPNCTNVRVMGYLNWFRIVLPVFDDNADAEYQRAQSMQNRSIDGVSLFPVVSVRRLGPSKRWKFCHSDEDFEVRSPLSSFEEKRKPDSQLDPSLFLSSKIPHPPCPR